MPSAFGIDGARVLFANRSMVTRFAFFAVLWIVLDGGKVAGLVVGMPAAALASWLSVRLWPSGCGRLRLGTLGAMTAMGWYFVRNSVVAGVDVAARAFHPRLPLRPGFVEVDCALPEGARRDGLLALSSLLPGSLPVAETTKGRIVLHCLDTEQPTAEQMAELERKFCKALGGTDHA